MDFKNEGFKPLDNFLKYEILFFNLDRSYLRFNPIPALTNPFLGAPRNSYYFKFILTELILEDNL